MYPTVMWLLWRKERKRHEAAFSSHTLLQLCTVYEKCIDSVLLGGDRVEILIIDDGSAKDDTLAIARSYEERYPGICRAIHQENGGTRRGSQYRT